MTNLFKEQNTLAGWYVYLLMLCPFIVLSQETTPPSFCDASTTWNGTSWSNGEPDQSKDAIFNGDYIFSTATFYACSLFVENGAHISFTQNSNATITHNITVSPEGELVFESGSNLIQILCQQNTGKVTIKRNSSLIKKDALTIWASPVSGQNLLDFSPETLSNKFYLYNTTNNAYVPVASPASTNFELAKGYLIRTEEDHPLTPTVWEANFEGIPNTGNIAIPLGYLNDNHSYNSVGNPYPSPINIFKFLDANSDAIDGTIWLWRKTDDPEKSSYAVVTKLGYQSNFIPNPDNSTLQDPFELHPDGILNTAQGFIVKARTENQNLVFNNDMREAVSSQNFFRTANQKDADGLVASRYWLNVTSENAFTQILVGYTADATTGYDSGLDGETIMDGTVTVYAMTDGKKLAIEARPEFTDTDTIPLGFKAGSAGTYTFGLDHMDGIFSTGQHVYLKDKLTGTITNLNEGGYTFTTQAGTFETRFEILYNETLDLPSFEQKDVIVYTTAKQLFVQSPEEIGAVQVYDLTGRIIYSQNNIASLQFATEAINVTEVVIVKITLNDNAVITKKIVLQ